MSDYYPGWLISLRTISQHLNAGKYKDAAELLFNPRVQHENRHRHEFWYAQILVAALLGLGFHIAFRTAKVNLLGRIDIERMLAYFEKYANQPEYEEHRDTIRRLIAYYKDWDRKHSSRPKTDKQPPHKTTRTATLHEELFH